MGQIVTKINEKGLNKLSAFLRKIGKDIMAQKIDDLDNRAILSWEADAFKNALIHNGKLYNCSVEIGSWTSKVYTYSFDLSEVETQDEK